jgi:hypothetical protein
VTATDLASLIDALRTCPGAEVDALRLVIADALEDTSDPRADAVRRSGWTDGDMVRLKDDLYGVWCSMGGPEATAAGQQMAEQLRWLHLRMTWLRACGHIDALLDGRPADPRVVRFWEMALMPKPATTVRMRTLTILLAG